MEAYQRLVPPTTAVNAVSSIGAEPAVRTGEQIVVRPGFYYTTNGAKISSSTYTLVSGDMWAIPFEITQPNTRFTDIGFEVTNAPTTGSTVAVGIYSDDYKGGYPGTLMRVHSTGIACGTSAGRKNASITSSGEIEPGLYWLVGKVTAAPTTVPTLRQLDGPVSYMSPFNASGLPISGVLGPIGWKLTGQGTGALPSVFPTGAALAQSLPFLNMLAAEPG